MYKNQSSFLKNRMHLMLKGRIDVAEMQAWSDDLIAGLKKLKPGFSVISEILECQPTTEEGRQILVETQRKAKELGMGNVVRIARITNAVTANQWQRSSRSIGYSAMEAPSVEEAESILDELDKNRN